jgi:hypothetical protein
MALMDWDRCHTAVPPMIRSRPGQDRMAGSLADSCHLRLMASACRAAAQIVLPACPSILAGNFEVRVQRVTTWRSGLQPERASFGYHPGSVRISWSGAAGGVARLAPLWRSAASAQEQHPGWKVGDRPASRAAPSPAVTEPAPEPVAGDADRAAAASASALDTPPTVSSTIALPSATVVSATILRSSRRVAIAAARLAGAAMASAAMAPRRAAPQHRRHPQPRPGRLRPGTPRRRPPTGTRRPPPAASIP